MVVDLTRILAGPWCTQMLGDYGAEVIKIERPGTGDDTRTWGPPWLEQGDSDGQRNSTYFGSANRNKKSVALDIASADGQDMVRRLVATADVLVENFKVGDLTRYGLDYESLRKVNPKLIYCSITGYGQTGPYAQRPGYDFIFQAEAGLMSVTGERDDLPGGGPQKAGVAIADLVTGMYACTAILAALQHRHNSGEGQAIDVALFDCTLAFGANLAFNHVVSGAVPKRFGNGHPVLVPYQVFRTSDGEIVIAAGNDVQWQRLCKALERTDLADDRRLTRGPGRIEHRDLVSRELERTLAQQQSGYWLRRLEDEGIPNGSINDYQQAFKHPQAVFRGMRVEVPAGADRFSTGVANPVRFSLSPISYRLSPPSLGEHTAEVLQRFSSPQIATGLRESF
ncbi:MAG: CoA transferase [Comamonadaceae bacterium]|nr:MAG: CoA transferase [Comamonadaceae bacterium]